MLSVEKQPDQSAQSMGDGPDGGFIAEPRLQAPEHQLKKGCLSSLTAAWAALVQQSPHAVDCLWASGYSSTGWRSAPLRDTLLPTTPSALLALGKTETSRSDFSNNLLCRIHTGKPGTSARRCTASSWHGPFSNPLDLHVAPSGASIKCSSSSAIFSSRR